MPSRENADDKGRRYLAEGRLSVVKVLPDDDTLDRVSKLLRWAQDRADRLGEEEGLVERITDLRQSFDTIRAKSIVGVCRGDGETYSLGYDSRRRAWSCSCPAKSKCAHLVALRLVTDRSVVDNTQATIS